MNSVILYILSLLILNPFILSSLIVDYGECNIEKVPLSSMRSAGFTFSNTPLIYIDDIRDVKSINELKMKSSRSYLLEHHPATTVKLTSSNTYSHGDISMTLESYINESVDNSIESLSANETLYLFGNNYEGIFKELSNLYDVPPCDYCEKVYITCTHI